MNHFFENVQPAVKKETKKVAISTLVGVLLLWCIFFICHSLIPQKVPFDYTVILGGIGGGCVAVLNFFMMGLTVQAVASMEDESMARNRMKTSYTYRMMLQMLWGIIAIAAPCFHFAAGLIPLLFPSIGIKVLGMMEK